MLSRFPTVSVFQVCNFYDLQQSLAGALNLAIALRPVWDPFCELFLGNINQENLRTEPGKMVVYCLFRQ